MSKYHHWHLVYRPHPTLFSIEHIDYIDKMFKEEKRIIIALESAGDATPNHIDIYVRLDTDIRKDKLRAKFVRFNKKYKIGVSKEDFNIAYKLIPIVSDLDDKIGYGLKEDHKKIIRGFTDKELDQYKELNRIYDIKKFNKANRMRVSKKNIVIYFKNYIHKASIPIEYIKEKKYTYKKVGTSSIDCQGDEYYKHVVDKITLEDTEEVDEDFIIKILGKMADEDYTMSWFDTKTAYHAVQLIKHNLQQNTEKYFKEVYSISKHNFLEN